MILSSGSPLPECPRARMELKTSPSPHSFLNFRGAAGAVPGFRGQQHLLPRELTHDGGVSGMVPRGRGSPGEPRWPSPELLRGCGHTRGQRRARGAACSLQQAHHGDRETGFPVPWSCSKAGRSTQNCPVGKLSYCCKASAGGWESRHVRSRKGGREARRRAFQPQGEEGGLLSEDVSKPRAQEGRVGTRVLGVLEGFPEEVALSSGSQVSGLDPKWETVSRTTHKTF